jgi:BASS family bile acid:Na+ symporter
VVVPLLAGMLLRRLLGGRAGPISQAAPAVAVLSIVVIIGYAVAANQAILREVGTGVFGLVVAVNLLGYAAGWVLGGVYRFSGPVRLALAIEIGMQNAGLGVALSLQHFDSRTALPGAVFATWCILTAALASSAAQRFRWAARNSQISRLD